MTRRSNSKGPEGETSAPSAPFRRRGAAATRVVIAESNPYMLAGLKTALTDEPEVEVLAAVPSVNEALERCLELHPDVLVIDRGLGCEETMAAITRRCTELGGVLVFLSALVEQEIHAYLEAGVYGFVSRQDPPHVLAAAIRAVARGEDVWLSPRVSNMLLPREQRRRGSEVLSSREKQVLRLLGRGKSNREIAAELFLSEGSVRNLTSTIYRKLHVPGRGGAMAWAWQNGLVSRDE